MDQHATVPADEWATIVRNVPIVSIDLVVFAPHRTGDGVVLAKRENEPAKGRWFVPGGRVQKGERLVEAAHRVARAELGVAVDVERLLGVYEHHYETADVADAGGKHYVPVGFVVRTEGESFDLDDQHSAVRVFGRDDLPDVHPFTRAYLADAGFVEGRTFGDNEFDPRPGGTIGDGVRDDDPTGE